MIYNFDDKERRDKAKIIDAYRLSLASAKTYPGYSEEDLARMRDVGSRTLHVYRFLGHRLPSDEPYCIDGILFNSE